MQLLIHRDGAETCDDLAPWLQADPVAGHISLSTPPPRPGEMGVSEAIQVFVENPEMTKGVIISVANWLEYRRRRLLPPTQVRIERDGTSVTITSDDPKEVDRLVRELTRKADGDTDGREKHSSS